MADFNILATTSRRYESHACSELTYLLKQIGDSQPIVKKTGVSGLIAAKTSLNPLEVIKELRDILHERPYEFRYLLRVIPIEKVVHTDLNEIQNAVAELGSKIDENETFRVTLEKRFTTMSSSEIIDSAAAKVKRKVNLTEPDRILLIEIVGKFTGISLITPDEILSVLKEKLL